MPANQNKPEPIQKIGERHSSTILWRLNKEFYRLAGCKCRQCGKVQQPRRFVCGYCGSTDLEEIRLSPFGTILFGEFGIYGVVRGFEDQQPTVLVTVQLDDGPLMDAALVDYPIELVANEAGYPTSWDFWDSLKGKRVRMVLRRHRKQDNGNLAYGYKFKIIDPPWRQ